MTDTNKYNNIKFFDDEERELFNSVENSDVKPLDEKEHAKMSKILATAVKNTYAKRKNVNLRLPVRDLRFVQTRAAQEGMPYQTLLASVIHKYTTGRLVAA